jgi:cell division septum initiation protein DivIVA
MNLNYSLESLPRSLFRGLDRRATEQLFGRLNGSYKNLQIERTKVARQLEELQQALAERGEGEQRIGGELERVQSELEASRQREKSLVERLDRAKAFMDEEVERIRAEATRDLERVQAEAERDLKLARAELAGYEKRELLVRDMLDATRRTVESIKEEARADAERILKKARQREAKIVGGARREHDQLEEERQRLRAMAAELRGDLSAVLFSTLEQLTPSAKPGAADTSSATVEPSGDRRGDNAGASETSPAQSSADGAMLAVRESDSALEDRRGATDADEPVKPTATPRRTPRK